MRKILALTVALMLPALPGAAAPDRLMTGAEFEAYVTGKTLTYSKDGEVWGTEQYLKDRKVRWAFSGEDCREGIWFEQAGDQICFDYEADGILQCWKFYQAEHGGLRALYVNDPAENFLSEVAQSPEPLGCLGPKVGT